MYIAHIKNVKFDLSSAVFLRNSWSTACYATVWVRVCQRERGNRWRKGVYTSSVEANPSTRCSSSKKQTKKKTCQVRILSRVLKASVESYTMSTVLDIFSNMFLIPVKAPVHVCAAHLSHFSQLFFSSSFNSFFSGVSLFRLNIQTGDACFLLCVCDTPLNPCHSVPTCLPRWSFASSERSFYRCRTQEFLAHAGLQSHRSVILGFYHICLSRCQRFLFTIALLKPFKDSSSGFLHGPAKLSCCLRGTVLWDQTGR